MEERILENVLGLIGETPLVRVGKTVPEGSGEILLKIEWRNPGGSVKDRVALAMIEDAELQGRLKPGGTIVEPTSGNTGIGLAVVAAVKGYRVALTMPEDMSLERRELLERLGVHVILTPALEGMTGAVFAAQELVARDPLYVSMDQFSNPANPAAHSEGTATEIIHQTAGRLDAFVAGVGTGGTLTGVAQVLKKRNPRITIVAVEPARSPVLSGGRAGPHAIGGIGAGFEPGVLKKDLVDEVFRVRDEEAIGMARTLARNEGLLAGISAGANVVAALGIAARLGRGTRVVTVVPDR